MMIKWHPPPTGWIKVNFDGSFMNSQASTSFVSWDCNGHVLLAGSNNIGENSINVAKSVALWDGLVAAIERGWDQIVIESDSKLVIDIFLKKASPPGVSNILFKIFGPFLSLSPLSVSNMCLGRLTSQQMRLLS
ncbi:unnamed protein product [Prunus armeniaca]